MGTIRGRGDNLNAASDTRGVSHLEGDLVDTVGLVVDELHQGRLHPERVLFVSYFS